MSASATFLHELVSGAAASTPDRAAIAVPDGPRTTFAEFDERIRATAGWLRESTGPGDRVAVVADNSLDYAVLYYAAPRAGRLLTLINQRLGVAEQVAQLHRVEPAVLLGDAGYLDGLREVFPHAVAFTDAQWQRAQHNSPPVSEPMAHPDDPAWLLFTSGSTGEPKGIVHSHRSLLAGVRGSVIGRAVPPGGVYLLPFPMCHIAGYNLLAQHAVGSTVLPVASYRPAEFVRAVNSFGVTSCSLAPTMLHSLLGYVAGTGVTMPTLREIAYGSAAMPAELLRRAIDVLNVGFHQGYGMTETGGNVTFLGPAEHRAGLLSSAGRPHPDVEVRIAGDGEILIRGEQVAPARWPDMTPVADDGWLHTGDVGRIDSDGRLTIVDRIKDVIITGGENVSSREVEDVLSAHPGIDQVAVVGVPDDYWGEAVCAVIVPGAAPTPTLDQLKAFVGQRLAKFKRPRHLLVVESLPMTTNGKVAKDELRRLARERI